MTSYIVFPLYCIPSDEIRTGSYLCLFPSQRLISGKEDAANNYARGFYTLGKAMCHRIIDEIRRAVELCDHMQGFYMTHSYGGGTGSGLTANLLGEMNDEFGKYCKIQMVVFPSLRLSTSVVEPYNCVLNGHTCIDNAELAVLVDNEALYKICCNKLEIMHPVYASLNKVIAQLYSAMSASVRFRGTINTDLEQIQTNLIPYPRLHFPLVRQAPLLSPSRLTNVKISTNQITREVFSRESQTINCDTSRGRFMAICLCYRGSVLSHEVTSTINEIRDYAADVRLVDWCPTGFKVGLCEQRASVVPNSKIGLVSQSVTMLANTSAMHELFACINHKFDLLIGKRSFLHWYIGEGMEEGEFQDARESLEALRKDYYEAGLSEDKLNKEEENGKSGGNTREATPRDPTPRRDKKEKTPTPRSTPRDTPHSTNNSVTPANAKDTSSKATIVSKSSTPKQKKGASPNPHSSQESIRTGKSSPDELGNTLQDKPKEDIERSEEENRSNTSRTSSQANVEKEKDNSDRINRSPKLSVVKETESEEQNNHYY